MAVSSQEKLLLPHFAFNINSTSARLLHLKISFLDLIALSRITKVDLQFMKNAKSSITMSQYDHEGPLLPPLAIRIPKGTLSLGYVLKWFNVIVQSTGNKVHDPFGHLCPVMESTRRELCESEGHTFPTERFILLVRASDRYI